MVLDIQDGAILIMALDGTPLIMVMDTDGITGVGATIITHTVMDGITLTTATIIITIMAVVLTTPDIILMHLAEEALV
jgi:hypothetical protein